MPMSLNNEQFLSLATQMEVVTRTYLYGLRGNTSMMKHQLDTANKHKDQKDRLVDVCNCWQAILIAASKAKLGHTMEDVRASSVVIGSTVAISVYMMENRRFIMFPDSGRGLYGIPSGLAKKGDILMYGGSDHIFLNTSEQLVQRESVMEFERGDRRGLTHLNVLEEKYHNKILICAPLPSPGELPEIVMAGRAADISMFSTRRQEELRRENFG